jgi:hypothetical protein
MPVTAYSVDLPDKARNCWAISTATRCWASAVLAPTIQLNLWNYNFSVLKLYMYKLAIKIISFKFFEPFPADYSRCSVFAEHINIFHDIRNVCSFLKLVHHNWIELDQSLLILF